MDCDNFLLIMSPEKRFTLRVFLAYREYRSVIEDRHMKRCIFAGQVSAFMFLYCVAILGYGGFVSIPIRASLAIQFINLSSRSDIEKYLLMAIVTSASVILSLFKRDSIIPTLLLPYLTYVILCTVTSRLWNLRAIHDSEQVDITGVTTNSFNQTCFCWFTYGMYNTNIVSHFYESDLSLFERIWSQVLRDVNKIDSIGAMGCKTIVGTKLDRSSLPVYVERYLKVEEGDYNIFDFNNSMLPMDINLIIKGYACDRGTVLGWLADMGWEDIFVTMR